MPAANSPPPRADVRALVARLLTEIGKIPSAAITDAATVDNELQLESVAFVELLVTIEDEYQIELDPIRVIELNQFAAIIDYITSCVGAARA